MKTASWRVNKRMSCISDPNKARNRLKLKSTIACRYVEIDKTVYTGDVLLTHVIDVSFYLRLTFQ